MGVRRADDNRTIRNQRRCRGVSCVEHILHQLSRGFLAFGGDPNMVDTMGMLRGCRQRISSQRRYGCRLGDAPTGSHHSRRVLTRSCHVESPPHSAKTNPGGLKAS